MFPRFLNGMGSKLRDDVPEAAVLGLFLGLSLVFVLLRVSVKTFLSRSWGSDDVLLVISLVSDPHDRHSSASQRAISGASMKVERGHVSTRLLSRMRVLPNQLFRLGGLDPGVASCGVDLGCEDEY